MRIGILGAMPEEVSSIKALITNPKEIKYGDRIFTEGFIGNKEVVIVFSRWGKVAASSTTTTLINQFNVDLIIFTGVAGAVNNQLNIGDIVIGNGLYQHDMDARPIFKQYQIPLTEITVFTPRADILENAVIASEKFINDITKYINKESLSKYSIFKPVVHSGLIASGDKFITNASKHADLSYKYMDKETLAVEMEGAAVAQVCNEYDIPYVVIRTISDKADHSAVVNFQSFIANIANRYSVGIINNFINNQ